MRCRKFKLGGRAAASTALAVAITLSGLSACDSSSSDPRKGSEPVAPARGPASQPQAEVTVQGLSSDFRLTVNGVREASSYSDGETETVPDVPAVEHAPAGGKLVIVTLAVTNVGMAASYPEEGNGTGLVELIDRQGRSYAQGLPWAPNAPIQPQTSRTDVYTFPVPSGVRPDALGVALTNTSSGQPSFALLALNGAK